MLLMTLIFQNQVTNACTQRPKGLPFAPFVPEKQDKKTLVNTLKAKK